MPFLDGCLSSDFFHGFLLFLLGIRKFVALAKVLADKVKVLGEGDVPIFVCIKYFEDDG